MLFVIKHIDSAASAVILLKRDFCHDLDVWRRPDWMSVHEERMGNERDGTSSLE